MGVEVKAQPQGQDSFLYNSQMSHNVTWHCCPSDLVWQWSLAMTVLGNGAVLFLPEETSKIPSSLAFHTHTHSSHISSTPFRLFLADLRLKNLFWSPMGYLGINYSSSNKPWWGWDAQTWQGLTNVAVSLALSSSHWLIFMWVITLQQYFPQNGVLFL